MTNLRDMIHQILLTNLAERVNQPDFGCYVWVTGQRRRLSTD